MYIFILDKGKEHKEDKVFIELWYSLTPRPNKKNNCGSGYPTYPKFYPLPPP